MIRRAVTSSLAAGVIALIAAAPALAAPPDNPVSGDPRATAYPGNVTTCAQVAEVDKKFNGTTEVEVKFIIDPTNKFVTITSVPDDIELVGTIVKGGPAFNVYPGNVRELLHSPLVGEGDKNIPTISHWFACGKKKTTTSSSKPSETSPSTPPSSSSSSSSSSNGNTTTTSPAAQGSNGTSGTGLANTGVSTTGPLVGGSALVLIGGGLLYWLRRTRRQG
jgi:hypothetical protein